MKLRLIPLVLLAACSSGQSRMDRPATSSGADPLAGAIATFSRNDVRGSIPLFEAAIRQAPADADRHAWLAEAARRLPDPERSLIAGRRALELAPCNSFAHTVLAETFNPQYEPWPRMSADSTWVHIQAAIRCEPRDVNVWPGAWVQAMSRGDSALADRALLEMLRSELIPRPWRTHGQWVLESAPGNAVLVVAGDMDLYPPLAVQLAEGVRRDVVVVNAGLLNLPWYAAGLARRHGLPLPPAMSVRGGRAPGDSILALWRRAAVGGTFGRPLLIALTVGDPASVPGPGEARLTGPFWQVQRAGSIAAPDTVQIDGALRRAEALSWRGPAVADADRSPIRRTYTIHPALMALHVAAQSMMADADAGRRTRLTRTLDWSERFARNAELPVAAVDEVLGPARQAAR